MTTAYERPLGDEMANIYRDAFHEALDLVCSTHKGQCPADVVGQCAHEKSMAFADCNRADMARRCWEKYFLLKAARQAILEGRW